MYVCIGTRVTRSNPSCFVSLPFYGEENTKLRAETVRLEVRYRARAVKVFYTLPVFLEKRKTTLSMVRSCILRRKYPPALQRKEEDLVFKLLRLCARFYLLFVEVSSLNLSNYKDYKSMPIILQTIMTFITIFHTETFNS